MKYPLIVCMMFCGQLSFAETAEREVYLVDRDNAENEQTDLPLFDRPENIIRLDREFPELVQTALNSDQGAPGDLSFFSSQSPFSERNQANLMAHVFVLKLNNMILQTLVFILEFLSAWRRFQLQSSA